MIRNILKLVPVLLFAAVAALFAGCSKDNTAGPTPVKQNPETELTYAPLQGDTAGYRVRLYWNGYDRDGEVVRFRYAIDSDTLEPDPTKWKSTTAKDTTLLLLVDPVKEIRGHVFWVSAEDNEGRIDPTPAKRFFSTKTIPPTSEILRGPSAFNAIIGPNFTYEWEGIDPDGGETGGRAPCDSFEYLLLLIGAVNDPNTPPTHPPLPQFNQTFYVNLINASVNDTLVAPHGDWRWTGIRGTRLRVRNASPGEYVFALRAVDLAGAREKNIAFVRNIRHFTVTNRNPGPTLTIEASVLTTPLPTATGPEDFPRREIQIFEGEIISFSWSASADAYGGSIVGFTYALDDTASFPGLDVRNIGVTYRPQDLGVGLHYLFVRVFDDGGLRTNAIIPFRIVHPTFKDPPGPLNPPSYLYVDDALSPGVNNRNRFFNYPSDAEEDEWMRINVLTPISLATGVGKSDWDTFGKGDEGGGGSRIQPLPADLAPYRVVIWSVDHNNQVGNPTALWLTLVGGAYSDLGGYLRAGGTLVLYGFSVASSIVQPTTALTANFSRGICFAFPANTLGYNQTFFPRSMMGIDGARAADEGLRRQGAKDFLEARVTPQGAALGYQTAVVDTGAGNKWDGKLVAGDPESSWAPGLPRIEGWKMASLFNCEPSQGLLRKEDASRPISTPLYTYHGAPIGIYMTGAQSPRENLIVGVQVQAHDVGGFGGGTVTQGSLGVIGRVVVLGFPMYFLKDAQATSIMLTAFNYVNGSPTLPLMP
ncbi:MAG TPA: hypothetical protein VFS09_04210 [Candidatus Eisenbacteria bacterium]|nr:hypothetical protein [Candidatus Eisenbacteria bacterium]